MNLSSRLSKSIFCILILFTITLFSLITPTTIVSLNQLTWTSSTHPILFSNFKQDSQTGLLSIRTTDGSSVFFPGNWLTSFSSTYAFAYKDSHLLVLTNEQGKQMDLDDAEAKIVAVETDDSDQYAAIIMHKDQKTRICFSDLTLLSPTCKTLDINKFADVRWSDGRAIIKTIDENYFWYSLDDSGMHAIEKERDREDFLHASTLFNPPNITTHLSSNVFLGFVFLSTTQSRMLFRVPITTQQAIWLDQQHILLKSRKSIDILEPKTHRRATLTNNLRLQSVDLINSSFPFLTSP